MLQSLVLALLAHEQQLPPCAQLPAKVAFPAPSSQFFMADNMTYLNVGSLGPSPRATVECAVAQWQWLEANKVSRYPWSGGVPEAVRKMAAEALGKNISLDELAHVPSTTVALNAVANGLVSSGFFDAANWSDGKPPRVLTTDQEHAGGVAAWKHYVSAGVLSGLDTVAIGAPPASIDAVVHGFAKAFAAAPSQTYAVLCVSHVLTTTGLTLPLPRLAELAHEHGALLIVDGAQAPGNIEVRLDETGADAYTVSAHKWLLAPTGSGLLYVRRAARPYVQPTYLDGGFGSCAQFARIEHPTHAGPPRDPGLSPRASSRPAHKLRARGDRHGVNGDDTTADDCRPRLLALVPGRARRRARARRAQRAPLRAHARAAGARAARGDALPTTGLGPRVGAPLVCHHVQRHELGRRARARLRARDRRQDAARRRGRHAARAQCAPRLAPRVQLDRPDGAVCAGA